MVGVRVWKEPKASIRKLAKVPGAEILWSGPILPCFLYPLSLFAASHGGLARINQPNGLVEWISELSDLAMFNAFLVSADLVPSIY
jgi:hypothetical protein